MCVLDIWIHVPIWQESLQLINVQRSTTVRYKSDIQPIITVYWLKTVEMFE